MAAHIMYLYKTAPEHIWNFFEERIQQETSSAVLDSLAYCLNRSAGHHPDRSVELSKRIFDRMKVGDAGEKPREPCLRTLSGCHVWRDHSAAKQAVYDLTKDVQTQTRELQVVLSVLREPLTHGVTGGSTTEDSAVRFGRLNSSTPVTVAACDAFTALLARSQTQEWSDQMPKHSVKSRTWSTVPLPSSTSRREFSPADRAARST